MSEIFHPTEKQEELFRQLRKEIADHTAEYVAARDWLEERYSASAIASRAPASMHDLETPPTGPVRLRARLPHVGAVAMRRLVQAVVDLTKEAKDMSAIPRRDRDPLLRRIAYVGWLVTDPDAREIGDVVYPWKRDYWSNPNGSHGDMDRWWARAIVFDPDYDKYAQWMRVLASALKRLQQSRGPEKQRGQPEESKRRRSSRSSAPNRGRASASAPESTRTMNEAPPQVAPDHSWLLAKGELFKFKTTTQREIIRVLYGVWQKSGGIDGAGMTTAGLSEAMNTSTDRLRVERLFGRSPALGQILGSPQRGSWALYLGSPPPRPPAVASADEPETSPQKARK